MRLDAYVAQYWPEHSRSTWQKLIKNGHVSVNNDVITVPKYELGEDDEVQVRQPLTPDFSDQTLPVVYEDDNVIVINKPVGVLTHAKGALSDEFTVASFFKPLTTYKDDTNRPGIVHRLDRATSGVLIGAKNDETARLLMRQFAERKTKKTYIAVVQGALKEQKAVIDVPIGRNPKHPSQFRVDSSGKSAETYYEVLEQSQSRALVKLQPTTGRTHQLRVHMAYLNAPIYGDVVYGSPADRMYLHAHTLEITIPNSKRMTFEAPIPANFYEKIRS